MAKTKGIRISTLAKDIGVASRDVTKWLKDQGLTNDNGKPYTASSTVSRGLQASITDALEGKGGTAVATKPKKPAAKKPAAKKAVEAPEPEADAPAQEPAPEAPADGPAADDVPPTPVAEAEPEPQAPATPEPGPVADDTPMPAEQLAGDAPAEEIEVGAVDATPAGEAVADAAASAAKADEAQASEAVETPQAPEASAPEAEPEAERPAAVRQVVGKIDPSAHDGQTVRADRTQMQVPKAVREAMEAKAKAEANRPRVTLDADGRVQTDAEVRPRLTLEEKLEQQRAAARAKPVEVAPQLDKLQPAKVAGPKVVRVEAPEPDAGPRRPRPQARDRNAGPGGTRFGPTAQAGGGVKRRTEDQAAFDRDRQKRGPGGLSSRRRGDRRGEAIEKMKEFTEADQIARRDALNSATRTRRVFDHGVGRAGRKGSGQRFTHEGPIQIEEPITIKNLSSATGLKGKQILRALMKNGVMTNINAALDIETTEMIALEFGLELEIVEAKGAEQTLLEQYENYESPDDALATRPPVVTILGHVDHGKTSLLDRIRNANVQAGEAGGITQHVGAFSVDVERAGKQGKVTFIDTPGHQAFTAMRARGADMTDIVVLVVDAAQGTQPQTIESINHAKAANKPIVVALNKIDLPDANPDMVLGQLAANELNPSEWGGDTEVVRTSAQTGQGIDDLLEILDLQAELLELKADPTAPAIGSVVEAELKPGLGAVATVLVQNGTLKTGDPIVVGRAHGRVRNLRDSTNRTVREAGPSTPVVVAGLDMPPEAGDKLYRVADLDEARAITGEREERFRQKDLASQNKVSLDSIVGRMNEQAMSTINLIVKGDVQGSLETLNATLPDLNTDEVRVKVLHSGVGAISESDVELAGASEAVVIGFHVGIDEKARNLAEQRGVEVRAYQVIYEIFDDLKLAMSGMLAPDIREVYQGTIEVRDIFKVSRIGTIAGSYVTDGTVHRTDLVRLIRDGNVVTEDLRVESLKRLKDDAREVKSGLECGVKLSNYDDVKLGDKLEFYQREEVARTLD